MTFIVLIVIVILFAMFLIGLYNKLITLRNRRENAFADVDVQLRQRHDLVPQLVDTVKGYAEHEKEVFLKVTEARSQAMQAGNINEKIVAEQKLMSGLQGLKITVENYPDLKASENFMQLQEELSDIENKLAAARRFFNSATTEYNTATEKFPSNLIANSFGFKREILFDLGEQREEMEKAPKINF